MSFVLVTGNPDKAIEAERILGYRPEIEPLDLPEMQSLDLEEVLVAKARAAWHGLAAIGRETAVVVEETGLELAAMNGFPGPLVKWMLEAIGAEGVARTGLALGNPGVAAVCSLAYYERPGGGDEILLVGRGRTEGTLILPPRGEHGFGWDPVFVPAGESRTYAELAPATKDEIGHRGRAWRHFREVLHRAGRLDA